MEPPQRWSVSAPWVFRDTEYTVSADVRNDVLVVEVEEKLTSDQWRGQFEAKRECGVSIWGCHTLDIREGSIVSMTMVIQMCLQVRFN